MEVKRTELVHRRFWNIGQSWNMESRLDLYGYRANDAVLRVKIEIRRNAYDEQSWATAKLFDAADLGWKVAAELAPPLMAVCHKDDRGREVVNYGQDKKDFDRLGLKKYFEQDEAVLLADVAGLFGR